MTSIGSINGVIGATPAGGATTDARQAALGTIGEIGHRVLSWVEASGGVGGAAASWAANTGGGSDFRPNAQELAQRGDVYGLGQLSSDLTARFGGTPTQEGGLRRSLEGFTREAVVQLAGLSGACPDRQLAGVRDALTAAGDVTTADGVDGIAQRLDTAAALLAQQNGR